MPSEKDNAFSKDAFKNRSNISWERSSIAGESHLLLLTAQTLGAASGGKDRSVRSAVENAVW